MTSSGRPQINGNREQANEVLLDGLVNTEDTNNEVGYQPAPECISGTYSVEATAAGFPLSGRSDRGGAPIPGSAYIQWWNPGTFSLPATNTFGTCGAGSLRGPRFSETDMSVHKDFLITETKRLEFRTEFINLFNHPILDFAGGIAPFQFGSGTFGQISASQG
jgi:hypothetical protein